MSDLALRTNATTTEYVPPTATPGMTPSNLTEAMSLAKLMADASLVPSHLQKKPADCLLVIEQAARWGLSPFAVAQCTSVIRGKLMFEGKLVAAVINVQGGLSKRLKFTYDGDGDRRRVVVSGTLRGETEAREVDVLLSDARTDQGVWRSQPDQQLAYAGTRIWARRHMPELMLGVYSPEEMPTGEATPLKWTSGTENAPKHVGVMTLAKELPDAVHEDDELTADVDVVDQKSGEVVRRPGASSGQIGEIHRLLDKLGHQMDKRVPAKTEGKTGKVLEPAKLVKRGLYYKHMMAKHGVKHSNELSSGGASDMIDWLLRCVAKFEKKLGAEPTPALPERCADGTCHRCAMCVEIDAQAAREAE